MTTVPLRRDMITIDAEIQEHKEKREAFRRNAMKAWNDYQAGGLHVTAEEADAWLAKLEAGQDVEPPESGA